MEDERAASGRSTNRWLLTLKSYTSARVIAQESVYTYIYSLVITFHTVACARVYTSAHAQPSTANNHGGTKRESWPRLRGGVTFARTIGESSAP